jgi:hypothetical protein
MDQQQVRRTSLRSCVQLAVSVVIGMVLGGIWSAVRRSQWAGLFERNADDLDIAVGAILGAIAALVLLSIGCLGKATPPWHRIVSIAILVLFACATVCAFVIELGRDPVRLSGFRRIKVGMGREEVERFLGPPEDFTQGTQLYQHGAREEADGKLRVIYDVGGNVAFTSSRSPGGTGWFGREGAIIVYWDDAGNVAKKEFYLPFERPQPTLWQRVKALLPW